jgi:tetratricopeptide (TPR) repeat protein
MLDPRGRPSRSRRSTIAGRGLALALFAWSSAALGDPATAEALFREGRRLLDEGRYDEACPKLAESHAQDPASGTLINLALCYEKQGRLATAWAHYRSAADLARKDGRADRVATADTKIAELESRVPRLIVHAAEPRPGMEARWASIRISAAAFDTPIPLDPGTYVITVSALGYRDHVQTITVAEKESRTLEIPALTALPSAPSNPPPATAVLAPEASPSTTPVEPQSTGSGPPVAGLVVGGIGLVALGVGTYFGLSSLEAYEEAEKACPTHHGCSEPARDARDEAETKAWISNISLGAGIIATGVGAWLVLGAAGDKPKTVSVHVAPVSSGAVIRVRGSL